MENKEESKIDVKTLKTFGVSSSGKLKGVKA